MVFLKFGRSKISGKTWISGKSWILFWISMKSANSISLNPTLRSKSKDTLERAIGSHKTGINRV